MKRFRNLRVKIGDVLSKILLDKKRGSTPTGKKVLIGGCQKLGNYIFKTPMIKGLSLAGYEVHILGSKMTEELAKENPYVFNVIIDNCYQNKSSDIFRHIKTGLKYRNFFDYYIDLTDVSHFRNVLRLRLLSAKHVIGIKKEGRSSLDLVNTYIEKQNHARENGIEVLKYFSIPEPDCIYDLHINKNNRYSLYKKDKPLILYNGLASIKSRTIPKDKEKVILDNLSQISWADVKKIEKESSLIDLAALIKMADLVVTVDTGITHMASSFNIPIIVHQNQAGCFPRSEISIHKSFYDEDLYKIAENILSYQTFNSSFSQNVA